jgi:hypothetical protein
MTNTQCAIDKAIVAIQQLRNKHDAITLREDADSALIVRDRMCDYAAIGDALGMELAFHAGLDRDEFNPRLVDALYGSAFEVACEEAAHERDADAQSYSDYRREHSTLHRAGQGC